MSADTDMVEWVARAICLAKRNRQRAALGYPPLSDAAENDGVALADAMEAARAALDASGIGELVEAGRALAAKIDALADQQRGPFAIRNAVANSHEMDAFRAALSRARATQETNSE